MFLTTERKPSFHIPNVTLDKVKDDDNDVEMDDNQSNRKMISGDEEDNLLMRSILEIMAFIQTRNPLMMISVIHQNIGEWMKCFFLSFFYQIFVLIQ